MEVISKQNTIHHQTWQEASHQYAP